MKKNKKVSLSKKPFLVLSRRAIAGWLGVIFLLCAWMFVSGVLVGRGTAPVKFDVDDLQSKLEISSQNLEKKQNGRTGGDSEIEEDKTKLDFYEALPEDREDTQIGEKKPGGTTPKKIEPAPVEQPPPAAGEKAAQASKPSKPPDQKADPEKKQSAAVKSEAKPSGKAYTVQVAAFKAAKDADRLVDKLKNQGYSAYRTISKVKDKGIWFRVRVGQYNSREEASITLKKLKNSGMQPIVVEQ